jgi:C4-dicarboxylate-specific signal transduction histidine kinase
MLPAISPASSLAVASIAALMVALWALRGAVRSRRQAVTALRESEQRYRDAVQAQADTVDALHHSHARNEALLRAIPDMMFLMSRDGTYLDWHAAERSNLFVPPEAFMGKRMVDVMPPDLAETFTRAFEEAVSTGQPAIVEYSLEIQKRLRFFETRIVSFDGGRRILSIARDVTDRRIAGIALRRAQAQAANAERLSWMGALAASISHEINQPLAAIEANASAGLRWLDSAVPGSESEVREVLVDIAAGSHRASAVIRRTLDLFSHQPIGRAPVHPSELVEGALAATQSALRRARVAVSTDVPADLPHVHADRAMLLQVLISLVSNAIDAMSTVTDRSLHLESSQTSDGLVLFAVEDTGPGLDPREAEAVFTPFHSKKPGHIGIGLSISRAIVEAHGGVLRVVPGSRTGARFHVSVPAMRGGRVAAGA